MFEAGDGENIIVQDSVFNNEPLSDFQGSLDKKPPSITINGANTNEVSHITSSLTESLNTVKSYNASSAMEENVRPVASDNENKTGSSQVNNQVKDNMLFQEN